jgi:hypothetical protein
MGLTALLLGASACGGEAVAGGERDVDVDATGDGSSAAAARAPAGIRASTSLATAVQGTVQFVSAVRLMNGSGAVPVGGAPSVEVRADGADTVDVTQGRVPETAYTSARIVFRQVSANVTAGLVIGGTTLTGNVVVDIPAGDSVVVQRTISVPTGSSDVHLLIDLNAATWLATANPLTRRVSAAAFQSAVQVEAM